MEKDTRFVELDVHAATIAVAVAEADGTVCSWGTIPNSPDAVRRLIKKLEPREHVRVCYEAGPTGYVLYRQLSALGVPCAVVAPTLVPVKAGDRVKNRSPRCREVGAELSQRGSHPRVGAGRGV